jgi:hypothetical protein
MPIFAEWLTRAMIVPVTRTVLSVLGYFGSVCDVDI